LLSREIPKEKKGDSQKKNPLPPGNPSPTNLHKKLDTPKKTPKEKKGTVKKKP